MLDKQSTAFMDGVVSLSTDAVAPDSDDVLTPSLTFETELLKVFVNAWDNPLLRNLHVRLVVSLMPLRIFRRRGVVEDRDIIVNHVMPLKRSVQCQTGKPSMVDSIQEFRKNWFI
ncbi:hypothetical protein DL96DRAFT_1558828 [Flagelloscypha sp. PMI_526]|nr:hypothetical protein DL96DRAFT_1558828 [Flagelloscypha sp. PMI_526]